MSADAATIDSQFDDPASDGLIRSSYWSIVWEQLAKNSIAVFGVWCIGALFVLAIYAPLINLSQPLVWVARGEVSFPFVPALFNRLLFENAVDVIFNLLLVLSPVYLGVFHLVKRLSGPQFPGLRSRLLFALTGFHFAFFVLFLPASFGSLANPLYSQSSLEDYAALEAELATAGESVFVISPLRPQNYRDTNPASSVQAPSAEHWLGTDLEGRDVFARMLYGTRISLTIGVVAVSIYVAIGILLGALAGYYGGRVDGWISRAIEVMICFPSFFLILTLAALVENRSIFHVMVIIGITSWTGVARLVRAEFLKHRGLEYAQAALALGIPRWRIIFGHILPNAISPVLVTATFGVASAILTESALSFLGIGDPSAPSWGEILNSGRNEKKLWLITAPGFAIFFVVSVFNLVGEGLRDALDPKLRK